MAVFRNWLAPLNKPGLRGDIAKAWLPGTDLQGVVDVDDRVDKALAALAKLSETLRQSFGLLHLEQAEDQRRHSERMQHRSTDRRRTPPAPIGCGVQASEGRAGAAARRAVARRVRGANNLTNTV
jgi:hypothetical protein